MLATRKILPSILKCGIRLKHSLPPLPYATDALEPIICKEIMELHHEKHHAAYVANLNAAEEKLNEAMCNGDLDCIISLGQILKFNGGGHINHTIFWNNLSPSGGEPCDRICTAINDAFGGFDCMKDKMCMMANAVQGSGWAWLGFNPFSKRLQLASTANQDPLFATTGLIPLFGIDVWEHAYYLQYKNARAEYTKNIFEIMNWNDINQRYVDALCCVPKTC